MDIFEGLLFNLPTTSVQKASKPENSISPIISSASSSGPVNFKTPCNHVSAINQKSVRQSFVLRMGFTSFTGKTWHLRFDFFSPSFLTLKTVNVILLSGSQYKLENICSKHKV